MPELNEGQIIKGLIKGATSDDFAEIKLELKSLREEVVKLALSRTPDSLLKISDLMKQLQLSRPSVQKLIDTGKLVPAILLEQDQRFRQRDVNQMIENSLRPKHTDK